MSVKKETVKRKMRRGGGKAKGASFERHIAKLLSLWVTDGEREDVFWRSAMSGGRATVRNRDGMKINVRQAGDICAVSFEGHNLVDNYYIELKHVKKLALDQFIVKGTGPLAGFWKIAEREARKHGKSPVIIARQNGWPDLVFAHEREFNTDGTYVASIRLELDDNKTPYEEVIQISFLSNVLKTKFHEHFVR